MAWDDFFVALWSVSGVGAVNFKRMTQYFGTPKDVFLSSKRDLLSVSGMRERTADNILKTDPLSAAKSIKKSIERVGARVVTIADAEYPKLLRETYMPPPLLFVRGELVENDAQSVSIVGSRVCSVEGKRDTIRIAEELARQGITVVSGLARGIDKAAHDGALKGGGRTLAVIGTGIDVFYPEENRSLQNKIASNGAVISIFPPGATPKRENFPIRNRVIAGISAGLVVVEANVRSGALITQGYAREENRDVCVVEGTLHLPTNGGGKALFLDGAKSVNSGADVIRRIFGVEVLPFEVESAPPTPPQDLTESERRVWEALNCECKKSIDQIIEETGFSARGVGTMLTALQMRELVTMEVGLYSLT